MLLMLPCARIWKNEPWLFNWVWISIPRGESELVSGSYGNRDVYSSELNEICYAGMPKIVM